MSLDDALESLTWAVDELSSAAAEASPVESLVILPLITQAADIQASVAALITARSKHERR